MGVRWDSYHLAPLSYPSEGPCHRLFIGSPITNYLYLVPECNIMADFDEQS